METQARTEPTGPARERWRGLTPLAVGLVPLALYLATLTPTVLDGDSADFARQSYVLGLAHPPGYPLMGILGKLVTTCLPVGPLGWRPHLVAALAAAGALAAAYALARRWTAAPLPAALTLAVLAVSPLFWSQAVHVNPYMPQVLVALGVILLLERWGAAVARRWLVAAGLLYGLGLGGHPSFALYAPALGLFVVARAWRRGWRRVLGALGVAAGTALLGCLPWLGYLVYYLVPAPDGGEGGLGHRLLALLTAEGSPSDPALFFQGVLSQDYAAGLARHGVATVGQLSAVGLLGGVVGAAALARRRPAALLLAAVAYAAHANFAITLGHWHFYDVYRLPTYVLLALLLAVGLTWLSRRLAVRRGAQAAVCAGLALLCAAPPHVLRALAPAHGSERGGLLDALHPQPIVRADFARRNRAACVAALDAAGPDGALLATWGATGTLRFLQQVEGLAPGVWLIADGPEGEALRWYLRQPEPPRPRLLVLLREGEERLRRLLFQRCTTRLLFDRELSALHEVLARRENGS